MELSPEITIEELVEKYPELVKPLSKEGVVCLVCGEPAWGTLREKVEEKGLDVGEVMLKLEQYLRQSRGKK